MNLARTCLAVLTAGLVAAALAAPASAAVTATITDPAGDVPAGAADATQVRLVWDQAATLTIAITYAARPADPGFLVSAAPRAANELDTGRPPFCTVYDDPLEVVDLANGSARLSQVTSFISIDAPGQWAGSTVTYTFTDPDLARRLAKGEDELVCLDGTIGGKDRISGAFDDKTLQLTPAVVRGAVQDRLAEKYGAAYTGSSRRTTTCPEHGRLEEERKNYVLKERAGALCTYAFTSGSRYRTGFALVSLVAGVPQMTITASREYPRSIRDCGRAALVRGRLRGWTAGFPAKVWVHAWGEKVPCGTARKVADDVVHGRERGFRCTTVKSTKNVLSVRCAKPGGRVVRIEAGPQAF